MNKERAEPQAVQPAAQPVARVRREGATVLLEWESVEAAHNAKPGPLYAEPINPNKKESLTDEREALIELMKHFPTDTDMLAAGWNLECIEAACYAYDAARKVLGLA